MNGWIGVDLDGTLADYTHWRGATHIGPPVRLMLKRVKDWLEEGKEVRIFTARVYTDGTPERNIEAQDARGAIEQWCWEHIGRRLKITCQKDYGMLELWDDRAVQVQKNTGERMDGHKGNEDMFQESCILHGLDYVVSTRFPVQKVLLHPFSMAKVLDALTFNNNFVDIIKGGEPDPLRPMEEAVLKETARYK